jgi:DNA-binding response OmpR family regulator
MTNILLLEDEPLIGTLYKKHLELQGYKVYLETHTENITNILQRFHADIIFLDYEIQGSSLNGLEIIPQIKKICPLAKIIMLSNSKTLDFQSNFTKYPIDDYLIKMHYSPKKLVEYIEHKLIK